MKQLAGKYVPCAVNAYPIVSAHPVILCKRKKANHPIPEALAPEILTWVKTGPAGCGLDRANWTYAALATPRYGTKGMTGSASPMRAFCTKHGVRPYRPTYRYLKGDPKPQEATRQNLEALEKKPKRGNWSC